MTGKAKMRMALVAMPWHAFDMPNAALGSLSAFVQREESRVRVDCRHEYLHVWRRISDCYEELSEIHMAGDLVYAYLLHGNPSPAGRERLSEALSTLPGHRRILGDTELLARVLGELREHLDACAREIANTYDVLALTTSTFQLFSSLCLGKQVKLLNPGVRVILGGFAVTLTAPSLRQAYPFVDHVIAGEGEQPLLALLQSFLMDSAPARPSGGTGRSAVSREQCTALGPCAVINDLNSLPTPDFDAYAEQAEAAGVFWKVPIEGSRGCWWNRRPNSGNPLHCCLFCGASPDFPYREKTSEAIAHEMGVQSSRYENVRFVFLDNVASKHGLTRLSSLLRQQQKSYKFFRELRATTQVWELLDLKLAGCHAVQIGVEGLSTSYLKRLNKGTTAIQNLEIMRACFELEIASKSNLLIGFPGATLDEVNETVRVIEDYAIAYEPLNVSPFTLDVGSAVHTLPERFNIVNIANARVFSLILPPDVFERVTVPWLDHEVAIGQVDWAPAIEACRMWRELHERLRTSRSSANILKPLYYFDGGCFLEVVDHRRGFRSLVMNELFRVIYLYCMRTRSRKQILRHLVETGRTEDEVGQALLAMVSERLMFQEGNRYLSLAVAWRPDAAICRIRAEQAEVSAERPRDGF